MIPADLERRLADLEDKIEKIEPMIAVIKTDFYNDDGSLISKGKWCGCNRTFTDSELAEIEATGREVKKMHLEYRVKPQKDHSQLLAEFEQRKKDSENGL